MANTDNTRIIEVVAALIVRKGTIFLCRRKPHDRYGGLWEFPGGKVEPGESFECAIEREMYEENAVRVRADYLAGRFYDEDACMRIEVYLYACHIQEGEPRAVECAAWGFFTPLEAAALNLAPVDIKILHYVAALMR